MNATKKLDILVIHGYNGRAATVAQSTRPLRAELSDIANMHYVDGPAMRNSISSSRPWWILDSQLEYNEVGGDRWSKTVQWWSDHLSENQYDGIIGISQGSAMTALLVSMISRPERIPGFEPKRHQPIKFAILCSGFVSHLSPHKEIYSIPEDLPSLHTFDNNDFIVPAERTFELHALFKTSQLGRHSEGHSIPVGGLWPKVFKEFIVKAVQGSSERMSSCSASKSPLVC